MSFGSRIKKLREEKELSTRELAKIISKFGSISASYISNIENDTYEPSLKKLKLIAKGLQVPLSYLLDEYDKAKDIEEKEDNEIHTIAAHLDGEELSREEEEELKKYIDFILSRRNNN